MMRSGGCLARFCHLPLQPKVSTTIVSRPRRTSAACRMEPIKPAPPVIRIMAAGYRCPLRLAPGLGKAISRDAKGNQVMSDRPRFFDDLAGVAGGAISALAGLRQEAEA